MHLNLSFLVLGFKWLSSKGINAYQNPWVSIEKPWNAAFNMFAFSSVEGQ